MAGLFLQFKDKSKN